MFDLTTDAMILATVSACLCMVALLLSLYAAGSTWQQRRLQLRLADRQHKLLCDVASTAGQVRVLVSEMDATRATQQQLIERLTKWAGKLAEYTGTSHDLGRTFRAGLQDIDSKLDGISSEVDDLSQRIDQLEQAARIVRDQKLLQTAVDQLAWHAAADDFHAPPITLGPGDVVGITATDDLQLGDAA